MFAGFLFTEKFFVDIINMIYSCRVVLYIIFMECGNYEDRLAYWDIVNLTAG